MGALRHARSIPIQGAFFPDVNVADGENDEKNPHLDQTEDPQLAEINRPGIEKHDFQIEDKKQHGDQIKAHREADTRIALGRIARLERLCLGRIGGFGANLLAIISNAKTTTVASANITSSGK